MEIVQGRAFAAPGLNSDELTKTRGAASPDSKSSSERKEICVKSLPIVGADATSPNGAHQAGGACGDDGPPQLSHPELKEVFRRALSRLLADDPILGDLHPEMTHQEVAALLEVEAGRSLLVTVERADGGAWPLRLPKDAFLHQLKAALRTHVTLHMHRGGERRIVNWRNVWRRYWLVDAASGTRLADDNATLQSLGVGHKHRLAFVKRDRDKNSEKALHQKM